MTYPSRRREAEIRSAEIATITAALEDSSATLAAIRAMTVYDDWGDQSISEHIHDLCGDNLRKNAAALKGQEQ